MPAGTGNMSLLEGLRAAVAYQAWIGPDAIEARDRALTRRLREGLAAIRRVRLASPKHPDLCAAVTNFRVEGLDGAAPPGPAPPHARNRLSPTASPPPAGPGRRPCPKSCPDTTNTGEIQRTSEGRRRATLQEQTPIITASSSRLARYPARVRFPAPPLNFFGKPRYFCFGLRS